MRDSYLLYKLLATIHYPDTVFTIRHQHCMIFGTHIRLEEQCTGFF